MNADLCANDLTSRGGDGNTLPSKKKERAMKVTTKGQVTIPLEIREQLQIQPGAEVEFEARGGVIRLTVTRKSRTRGRKIVERMSGKGTVQMTTDQIMALTRGD
jgi:AbrB family looped-hinge helix DNA binding protein